MPTGSRRALIATKEPLVGALLGLFVESAGLVPVFLEPDEDAGRAIARLRPVAVTFLSVDMGEAESDLFFAQASRTNTRIVVFGPDQRLREIAQVAAAREIAWFMLPPTPERMEQLLRSLADRRGPATPDRRGEPQARSVSEGTAVFVDRGGLQWLVYDRRASSGRRQDGAGVIDRCFVSELGESFCFPVEAVAAQDAQPATLERQLAKAMVASAEEST